MIGKIAAIVFATCVMIAVCFIGSVIFAGFWASPFEQKIVLGFVAVFVGSGIVFNIYQAETK